MKEKKNENKEKIKTNKKVGDKICPPLFANNMDTIWRVNEKPKMVLCA